MSTLVTPPHAGQGRAAQRLDKQDSWKYMVDAPQGPLRKAYRIREASPVTRPVKSAGAMEVPLHHEPASWQVSLSKDRTDPRAGDLADDRDFSSPLGQLLRPTRAAEEGAALCKAPILEVSHVILPFRHEL